MSLGGAYEEPDDPQQQAISKIARQVMTRLHIQVNQTIQFYRGQQGGAAPVRLFLSGGASTMPYTAQFFAEKLNMPVEYFNPLRNVQIDPAVNIEELAKIGHQMGELVGLGLRNLAHCPVELNLMPKSALKGQEFGAKKPYLIATMACLVAILFAFGYFYNSIAQIKQASKEKLEPEQQKLTGLNNQIDAQMKKLRVAQAEALELSSVARRPRLLGQTADGIARSDDQHGTRGQGAVQDGHGNLDREVFAGLRGEYCRRARHRWRWRMERLPRHPRRHRVEEGRVGGEVAPDAGGPAQCRERVNPMSARRSPFYAVAWI